jgi:ATP-dependent Clp protease ATP-binding subunit ClpC
MYPFERFTERAKKVLTLAQQEAQAAHHGYIGTEHLLLALLGEASGLGAVALSNLGVRIDRVRDAIQAVLSDQAPIEPPTTVVPTARVKRVVEISFEEARRMGHNYVGTEHLLLGLLIEGEGIAAMVLADLGVTLEAARAEIERLLQTLPPAETQTQPARPRGPAPSPTVIEVVERARTLAAEAGASEIGLEHLEQALAEWRAEQQ